MIRNKDVIGCLPLLASVLGDRYGVEVKIGGDTAYTNGRVIHIPALPQDCGDQAIALTKGYVDHESAHIRYTDFDRINMANMDNVTKCVFNSIEDWRVEKKLSEIYPGCRNNLDWLIRTVFMNVDHTKAGTANPAFDVLNYVLLTVRAWNVPELLAEAFDMRNDIEKAFPSLAGEIDLILFRVKLNCPDTKASIGYAKDIANILRSYHFPTPVDKSTSDLNCGQERSDEGNEDHSGSSTSQGGMEEQSGNPESLSEESTSGDSEFEDSESDASGKNNPSNGETSPVSNGSPQLDDLFMRNLEELPQNLGEFIAGKLDEIKVNNLQEENCVAIREHLHVNKLPDDEKMLALKSSNALRQRLSGLLQAKTFQRITNGRHGSLNPQNLYRLSIGNPKIFRRKSIHNGQDSAVHILVDASGSMRGEAIRIARQSCYSIAHALDRMPGVNPAVTVFPAAGCDDSVYPILEHGQKATDRFYFDAFGGTPLGPALWWVLQTLWKQPEERKIVLIITDGSPDQMKPCLDAIEQMKKLGIEVYGLGIQLPLIEKMLPGSSRVIENLNDLPQALFGILQTALLRRYENDDTY